MAIIMVNGTPGQMALQINWRILSSEAHTLVPFSLTGPDMEKKCRATIDPSSPIITLLSPSQREAEIGAILAQYPGLIAVDFTVPAAAYDNASFYAKHQIPFVMGTTGGKREQLWEKMQFLGSPCVIAPNMSPQIVALQDTLRYQAVTFPGLYTGFRLEVIESHQATKADVSGTAKQFLEYFRTLGATIGDPPIQAIRDPEEQRRMGVPESALGGHGWHYYRLTRPDGSIEMTFTHNVNGRETYVDGTIKAIEFLAAQIANNNIRPFDMIDVLKGE